MFPFRNPLALREERMKEGYLRRRIEGTRTQVISAAMFTAAGDELSYHGRDYLRYLCGLEPCDTDALTPEQKAYVGNLFEQACRARRSVIDRHPRHEQVEALPGIQIVPLNRVEVRRRQSEAGRRKRQLV